MSEYDAVTYLSNLLYAAAVGMLILTALCFLAGLVLKKKPDQADARYNIMLVATAMTVLFGAVAAALEHMPMDPMSTPSMAGLYWVVISLITGIVVFIMIFKGDL